MSPEQSFFSTVWRLQELIGHGPTDNVVSELRHMLKDDDVRREFFKENNDPQWIKPLQIEGYFTSPPAVVKTADGSVQHPQWPESGYLLRMASFEPELVSRIFSDLQTNNITVVRDILNAAVKVPTLYAVNLVPVISRIAKQGLLDIYIKDACDLCKKFINDEKADIAQDLACVLFDPNFVLDGNKPFLRNEHWYKEGFAEVAPALARTRARDFLPILCDWLNHALVINKNVESNTNEDFSYSWRPAIEEHDQNGNYDFTGVMVGTVRTAFEEAIRSKSIALSEALAIIEKQLFLIFSRLRLHLIMEFAEQQPELARTEMLNRDLFEDFRYKHEIAMLMGRRWDMLNADEKKRWLRWVSDGPDMSNYDESIKQNLGRDATDEDRKSRIQWWQYEKLHWIRDHLTGENRNFYEKMLREHGEPELADLNFRSGSTWGGDASPISTEQLSSMSFEKAVEAVAEWKPTGSSFQDPSIDGLSSTFSEYLQANRVEFSSQATILKHRPAIYVRGFISAMIEAVKANETVDVSSVLDLCSWVVQQPVHERTVPEQDGERLVDKDWQWTRDEISEFTQVICKAQEGSRPKYALDAIRHPIWELINVLSRDSADSYVIRDLSEDDPRVHDYLFLGSNSPRGKAMRAALEYARWVDNHLKNFENTEKRTSDGLDAMPEFRDMLAWHIEKENRTYEALSVLGSRINLIYWIDRDWLEANADALFDLRGIEQSPIAAEGWAAWNAFLVWVRPHIEFYRRFKSQFAYAVDQAAEVELVERSREQPMHHLGEHLMLLYGRGELGLDDDGDILRRFITSANPEIRRHAIGFVGQSLQSDDDLPEEVLKRFMSLWEEYWTNTGHADAKEKPNARLFGTWFGCGKFPPQWSIDRLLEYVEIAPEVEPDHSVIEHLAEIADTDILAATRILDRMVHGDNEGWRMYGWIESAERILSLAMQAGDQARSDADQLINYLGRRGYMDFGKLLKVQN